MFSKKLNTLTSGPGRAALRIGTRFPVIFVFILAGILLMAGVALAQDAPAPVVTTDKDDYAPGEVVMISGSGFVPGTVYAVPVKRPDGTIVTIEPETHATEGGAFYASGGVASGTEWSGNLVYKSGVMDESAVFATDGPEFYDFTVSHNIAWCEQALLCVHCGGYNREVIAGRPSNFRAFENYYVKLEGATSSASSIAVTKIVAGDPQ